jgi:hypothetical protein
MKVTEQGMEFRTSGHGLDQDERRVNQLERISESTEKMYMLIYDIPDKSDEPNPSGLLWWFGFRLNLSCWGLPQRGLDSGRVQGLLRHWQQRGDIRVKPPVRVAGGQGEDGRRVCHADCSQLGCSWRGYRLGTRRL